jgi:hypothetical protein
LPGHATAVAKEVEPRPIREEEDVAVATRAIARAKGPSAAQQGFGFNRTVDRNLVDD